MTCDGGSKVVGLLFSLVNFEGRVGGKALAIVQKGQSILNSSGSSMLTEVLAVSNALYTYTLLFLAWLRNC